MIELYEFALSGNCHKVRLMLSLAGSHSGATVQRGGSACHGILAWISCEGDDIQIYYSCQNKGFLSRDRRWDINAQDDSQKLSNQ